MLSSSETMPTLGRNARERGLTLGVSLSLGEDGGMGRAGGRSSVCSVGVLSLNIDFSFLMLCVGARPVSAAKLKCI